MAKVLVIDDDPSLLRAIRLGLRAGGHEVVTAANGEQGLTQTALTSPDVVVLDLGLPDIDGLSVSRRIRQWSDVPIIILSAAGTESRKVAALDGGADDYVTKPFGMAELEARIRTAVRHRRPAAGDPEPTSLAVGALELDLVHHEAHLGGAVVELTRKEFDVLAFLARNAGRTCTHQMILSAVWGSGYGREAQYLHAYVHRLRQKLGEGAADLIRTTPGSGTASRTPRWRRAILDPDGESAWRWRSARTLRCKAARMSRGTLRLYLGAAPGVGKTYAMLNEGWRRKERGTDVVIGWVQDHGRPQTDAQIRDLEVFPRRTVEYRGQSFEEMDTDGSAGAEADARPGRRAGPYQRARVQARQAVAGRRGAARGRHQRHLQPQPAASRIAQRRRGPHHGRRAAGDGPGPLRPLRRPDRAGRHGPGSASPADGPRQHLPARAHRHGPRQLLPDREPHRPSRAGAPVGGRPGGRGAHRLPRAAPHRRALGDPGTGARLGHRSPGQRRAHPAGRPHGHADQGRAHRGPRPHR